MEENMRPTTATHDNVFNFEALLHPGTVFEHPKDVVSHPDLTLAEKRRFLPPGLPTLQRSPHVPGCGLRKD
jgi:hypothetical protein